jgi:2-oxoglutarate dehydrogenase E2 component (dihydrolipoamide succinyltransferase)
VTELALSRNQMAVGSAVTTSHATTPPGFIVVRVAVDGATAYARAATRRLRTLVGLPELAVKAIATLPPSFPQFFAGPTGAPSAAGQARANVAVTVDVGTGLYLPVVSAADQIGLRGISQMLLEYRAAALREKFWSAQLSNGTILLTLSTSGSLYSRPIIFPGHLCAVSVGSTEPALQVDVRAAGIASRLIMHLGLAYDRRVLGTSDAVRFASALKSVLESLGDEDASFDLCAGADSRFALRPLSTTRE